MHVSLHLFTELFTAERAGAPCSPAEVLPDWSRQDRLGVVVHEPLGSLGASTLIQLAIARFYDIAPERRRDQYPPLFVFHVGGQHGDHSPLDVWPPRREVFLPDDPCEVLGAVRDRAITRLLVPDRRPGAGPDAGPGTDADPGWIRRAPSGWTDAASAREQIATAYAYSPDGTAAGAEMFVTTGAPFCEEQVDDVLEPFRCHRHFAFRSDEELAAMGAGPSTARDMRLWLAALAARRDEVPPPVLAGRRRRRRAQRAGGSITQGFRALTVPEALDRLAPSTRNGSFTAPKPGAVS